MFTESTTLIYLGSISQLHSFSLCLKFREEYTNAERMYINYKANHHSTTLKFFSVGQRTKIRLIFQKLKRFCQNPPNHCRVTKNVFFHQNNNVEFMHRKMFK